MNWNLSILGTPANPANYLVAAIYDASAPSVLVDSIPLPKPYTGASINISFLNVDPIVYDFILWESADTTPTGVQRNTFSLQPSNQTVQVRADLYLIADLTPGFASGGNSYTDTTLAGWTYGLERVPQGTLPLGLAYTTTATSWTLFAAGDVISPGEAFVLHFLPIAINTPLQTPNQLSGTVIITGNTSLSNTDVGKGFLIQGAGPVLTITLPDIGIVGDLKFMNFYSSGGSHVNANIIPFGSNTILWPTSTKIVLGQCEQLKLFKANGVWNVDASSLGIIMVGEIVEQYKKQPINTLFGNGALVSRTTYSRLWDYVQSLESGVVVPDANWANTDTDGNFINKGRYSFGDGSTTFRVPLLYLYGFTKGIDGSSRLPGSFDEGQVGEFNLVFEIPKGDSYNGSSPSTRVGQGGNPNTPVDINTTVNTGLLTESVNTGIYKLIRI